MVQIAQYGKNQGVTGRQDEWLIFSVKQSWSKVKSTFGGLSFGGWRSSLGLFGFGII
jgi:hypothetical protein